MERENEGGDVLECVSGRRVKYNISFEIVYSRR